LARPDLKGRRRFGEREKGRFYHGGEKNVGMGATGGEKKRGEKETGLMFAPSGPFVSMVYATDSWCRRAGGGKERKRGGGGGGEN